MARITFRRDSAGIEQILSRDFGQVAAANAIAATVRAETGADVVVDTYVARPGRWGWTRSLLASVTIRDARGRGWEVRDGVLSRAAAAQGLTVTRRSKGRRR